MGIGKISNNLFAHIISNSEFISEVRLLLSTLTSIPCNQIRPIIKLNYLTNTNDLHFDYNGMPARLLTIFANGQIQLYCLPNQKLHVIQQIISLLKTYDKKISSTSSI